MQELSKPSRKNTDELRAENGRLKAQIQQLRRFGAFSGTTKVCGELCRVARIVGPWVFIWLAVQAWAGKTTLTTVNATVKATINVPESSTHHAVVAPLEKYLTKWALDFFLALFGVSGVTYGRRQGKLRRDDIERLHPYLEREQKRKDPKRSSSSLTQRGDTHPKDE